MKTFYEKPEAEILRWAAEEAITVSGNVGVEDNDDDEWLDYLRTFKTY